jgi:hypothetical protein
MVIPRNRMKTIKNQDFSSTTARDFSDKMHAIIYIRHAGYAAKELTQQKNWWPEFCRHACDMLGWQHDPHIDVYKEVGSNTRADLEKMGAPV